MIKIVTLIVEKQKNINANKYTSIKFNLNKY
jgi:hypothetical protein